MHIPDSHPALPGHFPGHPVVPGVVLLDSVIAALASQHAGQCRVTGFPAIKFLVPLVPGDEFEVVFTPKREGLTAFEIRAGANRLVTGTVMHALGGMT